MKNNFQSEEGISILLTIMVLSVVLSIALGSSNIAIKQIQSMKGVGDSVIAFYAADNGIEQTMIMASPTSTSATSLSNGATYQVTVIDSSDPSCSASNYCITSIGSYGNAKRAIQSNY